MVVSSSVQAMTANIVSTVWAASPENGRIVRNALRLTDNDIPGLIACRSNRPCLIAAQRDSV
jgi:hypothetical protein